MNLYNYLLLAAVFFIGISGCGDNADRLITRKQIEAENENRDTRAESMEADLRRQMRFVNALTGTYKGQYTQEGIKPTRMRMTISASLPPYVTEKRIRTPEEIASDLQRIFIKVDTASWDPDIQFPLGGCTYENVRPDIEKQVFDLVAEGCSESFALKIGNEEESKNSDRILNGIVDKIYFLSGSRRTHYSIAPFKVELTRITN